MKKSRKYQKMQLSLSRGSKRRQLLSENLAIKVEDDRSNVEVRLTLRQAKALQKFLNDELKVQE